MHKLANIENHQSDDLKALLLAFRRQRNSAKHRGVSWEISFDEWMSTWKSSGKLELRGIGYGKYVMARYGDIGPYSKENIEIVPCEKNAKDARTNHPRTKQELQLASLGRGRGWARRGNSFQVVVSKKYIGSFKNQIDAELAYQRAASAEFLRVARINPLQPECGRE